MSRRCAASSWCTRKYTGYFPLYVSRYSANCIRTPTLSRCEYPAELLWLARAALTCRNECYTDAGSLSQLNTDIVVLPFLLSESAGITERAKL